MNVKTAATFLSLAALSATITQLPSSGDEKSSPSEAWNDVDNRGLSFNVISYGAKGDGIRDDSQAFLKAWNAACKSSHKSPTVSVPAGRVFLVKPVIFKGPCNARMVNFMVLGTIKAAKWSPSPSEGKKTRQWLGFMNVKGLHVDGSGLIDGQGKPWWNHSCRLHPKLKDCTTNAPAACRFVGCNNTRFRHVNFKNSPQVHLEMQNCKGFRVENVTIDTPGDSPNTDGIHVAASQHVIIKHSIVRCGDDCISIVSASSDLQINNIHCGPGHGISIGSLGKNGSYGEVHNVNVTNAFFNRTTNGARIKTWEGGRGSVRNVRFENLTFTNTRNPIYITQHYGKQGNNKKVSGELQISNVVYRKVVGTSASKIAIRLDCTKSAPCVGITMESISITAGPGAKKVVAKCRNAYGREKNVVPANPCLRSAEIRADC